MSNRVEVVRGFISKIRAIDIESSAMKIQMSKKMTKSSDLRSVRARRVLIKGKPLVSVVYRHDTRDVTKNYTHIDFVVLCSEWMKSQFFNATLTLDVVEHKLLSNKKNASVKSTQTRGALAVCDLHDRQKSRLIPEDTPFLRSLGISSDGGKVYQASQGKYRQINKFVEILDGLCVGKSIKTVADMGCGKGYLSFATYSHLVTLQKDISLVGYELRPKLVTEINSIARLHKLSGLSFEVGDISQIDIPKTDMVIALHACDIATDLAIAKGIEVGAELIVVSPCCHKQIRNTMKGNPRTVSSLSHGIMKERMAEWLTDAIRALLLESKGYKTKIMEFVSLEHTSKNLLITAEKTKVRPRALLEVAALKEQYGIKEHYLERLI
ncbi:MAG: SAM-dependent methyltransferase [Saprospiraceae bacterium]|nr:SAM-dependent methyltransferase [Saprospiraceae bacterium]